MNYQKECVLCPRKCKIDRKLNIGFCGANTNLKVARAALHFWEEPCISGENGSGAVFFSHCTLSCIYCQNKQISHEGLGYNISTTELGNIFLELEKKGAENINLITASHYVPSIITALNSINLNIPVIYNCGGYESVNTIKLLDNYVNIFLPDFKYYDNRYSESYSSAPDYCEKAKAAIEQMVLQSGKPKFDRRGIMSSGTIVRHMLLPGLLDDSKRIIKYLFRTYGNDIYLSIMSQYTPVNYLPEYPLLNHLTDMDDYNELVQYASDLGVTNAFVQEGESASESFIPPFDGTGIIQ